MVVSASHHSSGLLSPGGHLLVQYSSRAVQADQALLSGRLHDGSLDHIKGQLILHSDRTSANVAVLGPELNSC